MTHVPGWNDLPVQDRAFLFEAAQEAAANDSRNRGIEWWMVQFCAGAIDHTQADQWKRTMTQEMEWFYAQDRPLDPMEEVEAWREWINQQAREEKQREQLAKAAEQFQEIVDRCQEIAQQFTPAIQAIGDAVIDASRAVSSLWDQMEELPEVPLCPSHRMPLTGGRCRKCDR